MWTCSQFTDWLASEAGTAIPAMTSSHSAACQDATDGACSSAVSLCTPDGVAAGATLSTSAASPTGALPTTGHPSRSPAAEQDHGNGGADAAGDETHVDDQRSRAELLWKRVRNRMKQQVLYTLASAEHLIDQRPRSFELFGCSPGFAFFTLSLAVSIPRLPDPCFLCTVCERLTHNRSVPHESLVRFAEASAS
jgi:hypothetical protein